VYVDAQGRTDVEIRYATKTGAVEGDAIDALTGTMASEIKSRTNVNMRLRPVPRSELPTFEYKARRWTDERKLGYSQQAPRKQQ
jgi:phenylacetate-CoA ligase